MARNKKSRNKKYDPAKAQNTIKGSQQVESVVNENLSPQQMAEQETLFNLLERKIEIPVQNFEDKHLFIATPWYGGQVTEPYLRSMVRLILLMNRFGVKFILSTLANESLITRGRNTLVSFFMENRYGVEYIGVA